MALKKKKSSSQLKLKEMEKLLAFSPEKETGILIIKDWEKQKVANQGPMLTKLQQWWLIIKK